ncbi:MAG: glycosyl hydrolase family 8 [Desulfobacterales bacterium]
MRTPTAGLPAARRAALGALLFLAFLGGVPAEPADWGRFRERFVSGDGRVIDPAQQDASHSEGQGYGLWLALLHGDRPAFDRVLRWTIDNLQVRKDALFAWSWGRRPNGSWNVIDYNNASDGDLLIASALLRAAEEWQHPPYREKALAVVRDIRLHLAFSAGRRRLIAPGYYGFAGQERLLFNTGYVVFPAYLAFAAAEDTAFWTRILDDARSLLLEAAANPFALPPDWVVLEPEQPRLSAERGPHFGYEAARLPLYEAGLPEPLPLFGPFLDWVERSGHLPARVNLAEHTVSTDEAAAGFHAVFAIAAERRGKRDLARRLLERGRTKITSEADDYYSNALFLLATAAGGRRGLR